jgi:hypothetical protein
MSLAAALAVAGGMIALVIARTPPAIKAHRAAQVIHFRMHCVPYGVGDKELPNGDWVGRDCLTTQMTD